jgi:DNA-binding IclR family transcriptional regulator
VERSALVLRSVAGHGGGPRLADLAEVVDLPKTTIHRVVNALAAEGLLRIDDGGRIWLGPLLLALSRAATGDLAAQVRPAVLALHRELDETVDVSVVDGGVVRFIDQLQSTQPLRAVSAVGASFPLHATANGKAVLAALPPGEAASVLAGPLPALTAATITEAEALRSELARIAVDGIAFDREEHTLGICAAGVAIVGPTGPVLALSVPAPTERFERTQDQIVAALRRAGASAAALLGL